MVTPSRLVLAGALLAAVGLAGLLVRRRREADPYEPPLDRVPDDLLPPEARGRLAVLGFTSRFCVACRRTPAVAREAMDEGGTDAAFVSVDVADRPDLVEALGLRQTPTVLLVDAEGRVRYAGEGNPDPGVLAAYLQEAEASAAPRGAGEPA